VIYKSLLTRHAKIRIHQCLFEKIREWLCVLGGANVAACDVVADLDGAYQIYLPAQGLEDHTFDFVKHRLWPDDVCALDVPEAEQTGKTFKPREIASEGIEVDVQRTDIEFGTHEQHHEGDIHNTEVIIGDLMLAREAIHYENGSLNDRIFEVQVMASLYRTKSLVNVVSTVLERLKICPLKSY